MTDDGGAGTGPGGSGEPAGSEEHQRLYARPRQQEQPPSGPIWPHERPRSPAGTPGWSAPGGASSAPDPPGGPPPPGWGGAPPPPPPGGTPPPGWTGPPPQGWGQPYAPRQQADNVTASLVLGIVSLLFCGLLTGIPAIVLGVKARKQIAGSGGRLEGDGTALAGIITGAIGSLFSTIGILAVVVITFLGAAATDEFIEINTDPADGICNEERWLQDPDCGGPSGGVNTDPSDGVCDESRWLQDPDCGSTSGGGIGGEPSGGVNTDPSDGVCDGDRWMQDPDCG